MGTLFEIVQPVFFAIIAGILFLASLTAFKFSYARFLAALKSPFEADHSKILIAPAGALITAIMAFTGFLADPATKADVDDINANIENVQTDVADSQKLILDEIAKLKASMTPEEAKSFEEAFQEVLASSDARKAPARDALKDGRIEDAADQLLEIASQEQAASDKMALATQESYREAGALFYPINTTKALEGYKGALDGGSTQVWDYIYAARLYIRMGQTANAEKVLTTTKTLSLTPLEQGVVFDELGGLAVLLGDLPAALVFFETSLEIGKGLAASEPADAGFQRDLVVSFTKLGSVSVQRGDLPAAVGYLKAGLEIAKGLAGDSSSDPGNQRDVAVIFNKLGDISVRLGNIQTAKEYFEDSLEVFKGLIASDPTNASYRRGASVNYERLGDLSIKLDDLSIAEEYFEESLILFKTLAASDQTNASYQRDLSVTYEKLGFLMAQGGNLLAAQNYLRDCLDIRKGLVAGDPTNAGYQRDLSVSYERLGELSAKSGNLLAAQKYFDDSLKIKKGLVTRDPTNAGYQHGLSVSYNKLGDLLVREGDVASAQILFEDSRKIVQRLAASDPTNADYQLGLVASYSRLAEVDVAEALPWWKKADAVCQKMIERNQLAHSDAYIPKLIARKIAELENPQ